MDGIERFLRAYSLQNSVRAWTLTGSYGTGKSAFANYLTALCSPKGDQNQINAIQILKQTKDSNSLLRQIKNKLPESGLVRAVATAQREPIIRTVSRALDRGASIFWQNARGRKPHVLNELHSLNSRAEKGAVIESRHLIRVIEQLAQASMRVEDPVNRRGGLNLGPAFILKQNIYFEMASIVMLFEINLDSVLS